MYHRLIQYAGEIMKLKYVGDLPSVSSKGVGFDKTQPDKYNLLQPSVELLESLSYGATETTQHLHNLSGERYSDEDLLEMLKKHCVDVNKMFASCEDKTNELIERLVTRVLENTMISEDGRKAWLNNITLMRDYYLQYVINETAYNCTLDALAQQIKVAKVKEVVFPMYKNYGSVLHDLITVLRHLKAPIDAELSVEAKNDKFEGKFSITHR